MMTKARAYKKIVSLVGEGRINRAPNGLLEMPYYGNLLLKLHRDTANCLDIPTVSYLNTAKRVFVEFVPDNEPESVERIEEK